jgi:adenylate cyclase class 2
VLTSLSVAWRPRPPSDRYAAEMRTHDTVSPRFDQSDAVHEVEVKYHIDDLDGLVAAIAGAGITLSPPSVQDDQAYAPAAWEYGLSKVGVAFARLRTQDGRHVFTVKTPVDNAMACIEHETPVADRQQMHAAVVAMGYRPTVRIVKTRRTGRYGELSVCVDHITDLGTFLEVEQLVAADESGNAVQDRLDAFVQALGIQAVRVYDTYDSLLRKAVHA